MHNLVNSSDGTAKSSTEPKEITNLSLNGFGEIEYECEGGLSVVGGGIDSGMMNGRCGGSGEGVVKSGRDGGGLNGDRGLL